MQEDDGSKNSDQPQEEAANAPEAQSDLGPEKVEDEVSAEEQPVELKIADPDPVDLLRKEREELAAKLRTVSKAYTDLQQEMDSFRQRQLQLAEVKAQKKAGEVIETFFEPVQNLKRCLETAGDDADSIKQGLEMVVGQFNGRMDKLGLKEVPGVGARFDPNVHNALAMQPVLEKEKDGVVLLVHAVGYAVGSRVIQPAQVVIGKFEEGSAEA
jgi:molecular chaperone GrpE